MNRPRLLVLAALAFGVAAGGLVTQVIPLAPLALAAVTAAALLSAVHFLTGRQAGRAGVSNERATALGWEHFRRELKRSRRQEYPLVLFRLPVDLAGVRGGERRAVRERTAELVGRSLRLTDYVWIDGPDVYGLLTDTHRPMAVALLERLRQAIPQAAAWDQARLVAFPEEGVTAGKLLQALNAPPAAARGAHDVSHPPLQRLEPDRNT